MTSKQFQELADRLAIHYSEMRLENFASPECREREYDRIVGTAVDFCKSQNPRFDEAKFYFAISARLKKLGY